jgi:hypothetical protein
MLADLAVAVADGGTTIGEIDILRHHGELFGPAASDTTAWRMLAGCDPAALTRGDQGAGTCPPARVGPGRPARRHSAGQGRRA